MHGSNVPTFLDCLLGASYALLVVTFFLSPNIRAAGVKFPTIAIIPDAWHSPIHYSALTTYLSQAGYRVVTQRLPGCNSQIPALQSSAVDAAYVRNNVLLPEINSGVEVVLVAHSYGGCPAAVAAKGLSVSERREVNQQGGVVELIFICGYITRASNSLKKSLPGGKLGSWVVNYENNQLGIRDAKEVFYNDLPQNAADLAIAQLKNQSSMTFNAPTGNPAWADERYKGRLSYLQTSLDNAFPFTEQKRMISQSLVAWDTTTIKSGHSPCLSHPELVGEWIVSRIEQNQALPTKGDGPASTKHVSHVAMQNLDVTLAADHKYTSVAPMKGFVHY
ncbi:hypothetical protein ACLMJK_002286 [Lecanora helva]